MEPVHELILDLLKAEFEHNPTSNLTVQNSIRMFGS